MIQDRSALWRRGGIARGQRRLADTLRILLYKVSPAAFESLDFEDDAAFLDPLLFAWFTHPQPAMPLEHVLEEMRSGQCGWAIPQTGIVLFNERHTLLDRFLVDANDNPVGVEVDEIVAAHRGHLAKAFELITAHCPDLAADIAATTRRVFLYRAPEPYSFATLCAHGAAFLNVPPGSNEVFFLEDLAHQCAHVIFNTLTHDKARFLTIDPDTLMRDLTEEPNDPREVYSAFHALFTYTMICRVLSAVRDAGILTALGAHEALGRLGFTLRKFRTDLARLDRPGVFTTLGRALHRRFAASCDAHMVRCGMAAAALDLDDQPYIFDRQLFVRRNPLASTP